MAAAVPALARAAQAGDCRSLTWPEGCSSLIRQLSIKGSSLTRQLSIKGRGLNWPAANEVLAWFGRGLKAAAA